MRPLEESELEQVLAKLFTFVGKNIETVLQRSDAPHSLRLHKKRVYYVRDDVLKRATSVGRDELVALGTCLGKFTHSDKFRLTIGALDLLAAHAKHKMWVKPTSEMGFMYGNHLLKSGLGRISENVAANAGVVIYSMADVPIGFGVASKSTQDCRKLDPSAIVAYHLADVGEYLRAEDSFVQGKKD
jgi:60S ribosome subunit biogenesis protein NIP7